MKITTSQLKKSRQCLLAGAVVCSLAVWNTQLLAQSEGGNTGPSGGSSGNSGTGSSDTGSGGAHGVGGKGTAGEGIVPPATTNTAPGSYPPTSPTGH